MRQVVDGAGAVLSAREWTPFGVEVGIAQEGLGYTGEYWTGYIDLLYLRSRWYDGEVGRFTAPDTIVPDFYRPQSINGYGYVLGNPINLDDPSGHCASDCRRFVDEVRRFTAVARTQETPGGGQLSDTWIVKMLCAYYSGFRVTRDLGCLTLPVLPPVLSRGPTRERWRLQDPKAWQVFDEPPVDGAEEAALHYGFKRIFYDNTHHYFASFCEAWMYGSIVARYHNHFRELGQYASGQNDYYDSAADILVTEVAIEHMEELYWTMGTPIDTLPQLLGEDVCGDSLEEIYAEWVWPNPLVEMWLGPPPQD